MSPDLAQIFDDAGRTPPTAAWGPDDVVRRGRRARTRRQALTGAATLAAAAAVVVAGLALVGPLGSGAQVQPGSPSVSPTGAGAGQGGPCTADEVGLALGAPEGAAGTAYYTVVVSAVDGASCTLTGHPFVEVVLDSGSPLRAAAGGTASESVSLSGAAAASFAVAIAASGNYDPAVCEAGPARRLDVVLPQDASGTAIPVALPEGTTVCTGTAAVLSGQVTVLPVVAGTGGQQP